jgi:hypothetical protein
MQEIDNHANKKDKDKIKTLGCAAHLQMKFDYGIKKNGRMKVSLDIEDP